MAVIVRAGIGTAAMQGYGSERGRGKAVSDTLPSPDDGQFTIIKATKRESEPIPQIVFACRRNRKTAWRHGCPRASKSVGGCTRVLEIREGSCLTQHRPCRAITNTRPPNWHPPE